MTMNAVRETYRQNHQLADLRYVELATDVERLYRRLSARLAVDPTLGADLQALVLRLGDQRLAIKELELTGAYQATNVSYTVGKLRDLGLIDYQPDTSDRRLVHVQLSPAGRELYARLATRAASLAAVSTDETLATLHQAVKRVLRDLR
jgi:DNA-binding MarR family transcriptional regulator